MIEEVPMRRKGFKTKVMAVVLSASMAMSVCPATAFAAPEEGEAVVEGEAIDADAEDVKEETAAAAEAAAAEEEADAEETIVEEETEEVLTEDAGAEEEVLDQQAAGEEEEYKYVYAPLTWAEYWASEDIYLSGSDLNASLSELDSRKEADKGAFDAISRATTNHGLHRGSYQCTAVAELRDGRKLAIAYYPDEKERTKVVLTDGTEFTYTVYKTGGQEQDTDVVDYTVTGLKYVPVKVAATDYEAFKAAYPGVVENGNLLQGGFTEGTLSGYTDYVADVTENTNGLKTAVKSGDGFTFTARETGADSGIEGTALKKAENINVVVRKVENEDPSSKDATIGTYGEFMRVDLTGAGYGALGAAMQAAEWTYYGDDSTFATPLRTFGTKFAADNWMHKSMGIQLGLTESLRCELPEGTDGTGYWKVTVYALGYKDYTFTFKADKNNVKGNAAETVDTTKLQAVVDKASKLKKEDYTAATWSDFEVELEEAKDMLANAKTQAAVNEAITHLEAAMEALVTSNGFPFNDVTGNSGWRYEAVKYVYENGIMNGINPTRRFAPDDTLTREMFATMIYRIAGSPAATYNGKFADVPDGNYFSVPISWANAKGIINGHSDTGLFGRGENIRREDLVTIMYRYAQMKGISTNARADLSKFGDAAEVSGYAVPAVQWAVANGIITGRSNTGLLDPSGNATRIEAAAIIQRFLQKFGK